MGKTFKELREDRKEENNNKKSKYSKNDKIRFALKHGANELKIIINGKPVDSEFLETRKPIHQ